MVLCRKAQLHHRETFVEVPLTATPLFCCEAKVKAKATSQRRFLLILTSQVLSSRLAVSLAFTPCTSSPKTSCTVPNGIQNLKVFRGIIEHPQYARVSFVNLLK